MNPSHPLRKFIMDYVEAKDLAFSPYQTYLNGVRLNGSPNILADRLDIVIDVEKILNTVLDELKKNGGAKRRNRFVAWLKEGNPLRESLSTVRRKELTADIERLEGIVSKYLEM